MPSIGEARPAAGPELSGTVAVAPSQRLSYIDGLRAVAAIGVVLCHTEMQNPIRGTHFWLDGGHGVDLFFVLSGFCLSYPALQKMHLRGKESLNVVRFAAHRIVRILPPYYLATALLLLVALISRLHGGPFAPPGTAPLGPLDLVAQFFMLDRGTNLASPPYWTLVVEMRWYLVFPLLLALWVRAPRAFVATIALIYVAYFCTRERNLDFGTLPAFMIGIAAASVTIRSHPLAKFALPGALAALAAALVLEPFIWTPNGSLVEKHTIMWQTNPGWALTAFFLVIAAGRISWLRRALSLPFLAFLGVASYSIYLMHYPIVVWLAALLPQTGLGFLVTVVAALFGGLVFYFAVEQWFCSGTVRTWLYAQLEPRIRTVAAWLTSGAGGGVEKPPGTAAPEISFATMETSTVVAKLDGAPVQ